MRVTGGADICKGSVGQPVQIFFLDAQFRQMLGNTYTDRQILHGLYGCVGSFFAAHAGNIYVHGFGDLYIFVEGSRCIEFHDGRQQQCVGNSVRNIKDCSKRVSHAMYDSQTYIREGHTCDILRDSHTVAGFPDWSVP